MRKINSKMRRSEIDGKTRINIVADAALGVVFVVGLRYDRGKLTGNTYYFYRTASWGEGEKSADGCKKEAGNRVPLL